MKKWKCTICNYIHTGDEPPEICPVCGADKSMFVEVVDEQPPEAAQSVEPPPQEKTASVRIWTCAVCGYLHEGDEPPATCPVCGAEKNVFVDKAEAQDQQKKESEPVVEKSLPSQPAALSGRMDVIAGIVMRHHLHPIAVHTPNGVIPVAVIFIILAMVFNVKALDFAAFVNMIFVLLSMPVVIATGYLAWQKKYRGALTSIFVGKIICSAIITVLLTLMLCWRLIDVDVALRPGISAWVYLIVGLVVLGAAGIAGNLGGKLVFNTTK